MPESEWVESLMIDSVLAIKIDFAAGLKKNGNLFLWTNVATIKSNRKNPINNSQGK